MRYRGQWPSTRQLLSERREVEITITGACDGIGFMGTTYIRVINRGRAAKRQVVIRQDIQ